MIASYTDLSNPTRSILFTHSTRWGTPSNEAMKAWRLVCSMIPFRASTSSITMSAVDAPVTMLRVY